MSKPCWTRQWRLRVFTLLLAGAATLAAHAASKAAATVSNRTLRAQLASSPGKSELQIRDIPANHTISIPEIFAITLQDGSSLQPARLHWDSSFHPEAAEVKTICADLSDEHSGARFHWCLLAQEDRNYMREQLTIQAGAADLPIAQVRLLEFTDPEAHVIGTVKGSPIADDAMFFGFEHPLSVSHVSNGLVQSVLSRELPLRAHQSVTYSAVIGTFPPGQLRRSFLTYIEDERPRAYSPFLNYNTWYDIGYQNRYSEADALNRIHAFGTELMVKRHVRIDSFVFDDGWDNPNSFWGFDSGFPDGFTRVASAAAQYHAGIGVWLSPWGGYDQQKLERVAFGRAHGYEITKGGFALSGPKYFHGFSSACDEMIQQYHANLFKFDGTGNADRVFPGSLFDSDFAAAIHLIHQIRGQKPGIFINLTTGTYPSPFWLLYADSIWRGGDDHSFAGVGSQRQQWMTYRDEQTYRNIVLSGPLFPLNSLMVHGMIYAKQAEGLSTDPKDEFPEEILSYFGSGTQLQEMYITPSLLSQADWDLLARAAKWSRAHATILKDTHWVGGDPGKLQIYGWAAWSPKGWIITLRNPSDRPQDYTLYLKTALELPSEAEHAFQVKQPFASSNSELHWSAAHSIPVRLQPFEVRIFESQ
jgi:hypothetical protein